MSRPASRPSRRIRRLLAGATAVVSCLAVTTIASEGDDADKEPDRVKSAVSGLKLRSVGPALMSGRISDLAVDPDKPNTWYVAVGSGNLWKTTNAGTTFEPIFENQGSYSIGCVTIDPSDRHTIWVGTGEAVGGRHVGFGDGVYRSRDGGKSFENVGLKESEHLAKIVVDPRDSRVVFVASQGPLWSKGGERGLFKTIDDGETWTNVLSGGEYTGVTDVVMDPRDPDVLYAATHQRHRTVAALLNAGPESGIHKSTDGGATWRELKTGLPGGDKGKIALAVSPQRPDVVYATIELPGLKGGFWRSENGGESWEKRSDYVGGGTGPHYYQELWADPHRFDVLYQANVVLGRTEDGGKTWNGVGNRNKHVDNHAVAFHPTDPDFVLVGCDGGLYKSYDYASTYSYCGNLPLTQFYKVDVDYDWPVYHIVGGTQDNNTQYGPTRTLSRNGIANRDWRILIGGDGHDCAIDPKDPDVIYCESQQGYLRRYDRVSGESVDIRPQPGAGEDYFNFNWDSPILISPHDHRRVYFGSKLVHRSDDRGDSWTSISDDLSRGRDRFTLPMMDRVWSIDAAWDLRAMSKHGNVTSLTESPLVEDLLYAGTDDGLIHVTDDAGRSGWRNVGAIDGIPELAFVNDVKADLHDPDTVYAALDNHKEGDYAPYLIKSTDRGRTWTSITGDLPDRHLVWRVIQDHVDPDLLFAGTEFGIFVTVDGGERWIKMPGSPVIPFRDLEIQRRENDLVGASFGRSFYVLDDYSPLRGMDDALLADSELLLFPVKNALRYIPTDRLGGLRGSQGDAYYAASNPPFGATFTCWLRDDLKSAKALRQAAEKERKKAGEDNPRPSWDELRAEDREDAPMVVFEVRDARDDVVARVDGPTSSGLHRVTWDLRLTPLDAASGRGPLALPGRYSVRAWRRAGDVTTPLSDPVSFEVQSIGDAAVKRQDPGAILAFQEEVGALRRAVRGASSVVDEALLQVREIEALVEDSRTVDLKLLDDARGIEVSLLDADAALSGDATKTKRHATGAPSIESRLRTALQSTLRNTYGPTGTQRQQYEIAAREYGEVIGSIRRTVEVDLENLKDKLDQAGAPWTRGRKIPALGPKGSSQPD